MQNPVNSIEEEYVEYYTQPELWTYFRAFMATFEYLAANTSTEQLNATRQHFSLLTRSRLPAQLREYLGTDTLYNENKSVMNDSQRMVNILEMCISSDCMVTKI